MAKLRAALQYAQPPARKEPLLTTVLGLVDCALLCVGCFLGLLAGLAFDAPGSENHKATVMFVLTSLALPVSSLISLLLGIFLSRNGRHRGAQLVLLIPLLVAVILVIDVAWIQFNGGRF